MEIMFLRDPFLQSLQAIMGVVEKRHTFPILSNILFQANDNTLSLTATDLELELKSETSALSIKTPGVTTIPGRKLFDIIRTLPEASNVTISLENQKIILKSGRARYVLSTLPADGYPNIGTENIISEFSILEGALLNVIEKTHFAMAHQDVRYFLNGMCLELQDDKLRVVALDGHRLSLSEANIIGAKIQPTRIIIPRKGISELLRLLKNSEDSLHVKISNQHIHIENSLFSMNSKLIEGQFPGIGPLLKNKGEQYFCTNREDLKQLLTGMAILCNDKSPTVNLSLTQNLLKIKAHNPEQEQAENELEIDYQGENINFCLNVNYLLDVINSMSSSQAVKFLFNNSDSGLFIESEGDPNTLNLIMPLRT